MNVKQSQELGAKRGLSARKRLSKDFQGREDLAKEAYQKASQTRNKADKAYYASFADALMGVEARANRHETRLVFAMNNNSSQSNNSGGDQRWNNIGKWKTFFGALFSTPIHFSAPGGSEGSGGGGIPSGMKVFLAGVALFIIFQVTLHNIEVSLIVMGIGMREVYRRTTSATVERWQFNSILLGIIPTLPTWMGHKWPLIVAIIFHGFLWNSMPWVVAGRKAGDDKNQDGKHDSEHKKEDDMPGSV
jgi:hypothetical protein